MNTPPALPAPSPKPKISMEAAGALLKEALEAEKKDNVAETARKRAAQAAAAASAPVPREAAAEAETAVPEQE